MCMAEKKKESQEARIARLEKALQYVGDGAMVGGLYPEQRDALQGEMIGPTTIPLSPIPEQPQMASPLGDERYIPTNVEPNAYALNALSGMINRETARGATPEEIMALRKRLGW